ncbi:SEC59/DGK1/VTE5 family protein [Halorhodospira halochloris]|uniref:diacylglycerol/polyprenol kinase family protein n=1 Tax=Halorhodospira halochloris TaxID=1052 RepID=UPI001EE8B0ED|nr:diacylglycerol/polyprenol kinase family protein [Halorhodospira halochloris]MCG5530648.1 SEC59/DGK1/VTE5 family protein [Halorhodospira halochloris]
MTTSLFHAALAIIGIAAIIAIAEGLRRYFGAQPEFARKIAHIGGGHIILIAWWFEIPVWLAITTTALVTIGVILSLTRLKILVSGDGTKRTNLGFFYYALSHVILISVLWPLGGEVFAVLGILIMAWGDGLAGFVGYYLGRHRYNIRGATKSFEGSATMFLVSTALSVIVLAPFYGLATVILPAVAIGTIATLFEAISRNGEDNLTVSLATAFVAYLLLGI